MKAELNALVENVNWEVVDESNKGTNIVDSKWVLKIKFDADSDVERFKSRLNARGFSQKYGVDFLETFPPVIKMSSVRLFYALSSLLGLRLTHYDVRNSYVNVST